MKRIKLPLTEDVIKDLHAGDNVLLSGTVFVARDAAHRLMVESIKQGQPLPFDINGQTIYYMGPSPSRPGQVIGAAGPTTSGRMDTFSPLLIKEGLRGMIGKGNRSRSVKEAIISHKAIYFAAIGGIGALISKRIKKSEIIAYPELGAEAIRKIEVEDFPVTVINDVYGNDLYEQGKARYRKDKK